MQVRSLAEPFLPATKKLSGEGVVRSKSTGSKPADTEINMIRDMTGNQQT